MTSQGQRDASQPCEVSEELSRRTGVKIHDFASLLESRRLEVHKEPFRGFDSPPGRF